MGGVLEGSEENVLFFLPGLQKNLAIVLLIDSQIDNMILLGKLHLWYKMFHKELLISWLPKH